MEPIVVDTQLNNILTELSLLKDNVSTVTMDQNQFQHSLHTLHESLNKMKQMITSLSHQYKIMNVKIDFLFERFNALSINKPKHKVNKEDMISINDTSTASETSCVDSSITIGSESTNTNKSDDMYSINSGLAPPDSTDLYMMQDDDEYIPSEPSSHTTDSSSIKITRMCKKENYR